MKRAVDSSEAGAIPAAADVAATAAARSRPWLLDTSALLSFIEDEEGADRVEQALQEPTTLVPWPALLEMHYVTVQEVGQAEPTAASP